MTEFFYILKERFKPATKSEINKQLFTTRLEIAGDPWHLWVGALDGEEDVLSGHDGPLRHSSDPHRQAASTVLPPEGVTGRGAGDASVINNECQRMKLVL